MQPLTPKDTAEAIALYRSEIVGSLTRRELDRGQLAEALGELSRQRFRPPRSHSPRAYSVATLERWYYAYKDGGLDALRPRPRADRGRGRDMPGALRELLIDIRKEHASASVPLILQTLEADGRLEPGTVSASTVRRFFAERGLDKASLRAGGVRGKQRLRWQAEHPGALWQGDVCHGSPLVTASSTTTVRVHALMDDASRYVVALEAMEFEREIDMLSLLVPAVRKHGPPDAMYLDNGATYRGETLSLACARMGTTLVHAKPYDAPARGKIERFWRTLREGCLDHIGSLASLHDINVRLWAWLDERYHRTPHGALMGKTPHEVFTAARCEPDPFDEAKLRAALTVHARRRVRRDNTIAMDGVDWETDLHFLAGQLVSVSRCLVDPGEPPWIDYEGKRFVLHPVDPVRNATRPRSEQNLDVPHAARVPFDPPRTLLDKSLGRKPEASR